MLVLPGESFFVYLLFVYLLLVVVELCVVEFVACWCTCFGVGGGSGGCGSSDDIDSVV